MKRKREREMIKVRNDEQKKARIQHQRKYRDKKREVILLPDRRSELTNMLSDMITTLHVRKRNVNRNGKQQREDAIEKN